MILFVREPYSEILINSYNVSNQVSREIVFPSTITRTISELEITTKGDISFDPYVFSPNRISKRVNKTDCTIYNNRILNFYGLYLIEFKISSDEKTYRLNFDYFETAEEFPDWSRAYHRNDLLNELLKGL